MRVLKINLLPAVLMLSCYSFAQQPAYLIHVHREKRALTLNIENNSDSCLWFFDKQFTDLKLKEFIFYADVYDECIMETDSSLTFDLTDTLRPPAFFHPRVNRLLEFGRWTEKCIEPREIVRYRIRTGRKIQEASEVWVVLQLNGKRTRVRAEEWGLSFPTPR